MDLNNLNNRENKSLTEEYIARIQFKPLATNKDLAYNKIWNRIQSEKLVDFGVSPEVSSVRGLKTRLILPDITIVWLNLYE